MFVDELSALEALQAAGLTTAEFTGQSWATTVSQLAKAGYRQLPNGLWTTGALSTIGATEIATTGVTSGAVEVLTGDAILAADGSVAAYLGGTGASAATVGVATEAAGAITLTAPEIAIIAVAGACGLALGYDTGQYLYSKFFGDDDFDWSKDSIGGKIITYLKGDGTTYLDEDLVERIQARLQEVGVFDTASVNPINPTLNTWVTYKTLSFSDFESFVISSLPSMFTKERKLYIAIENTKAAFDGFKAAHGNPPENSVFYYYVGDTTQPEPTLGIYPSTAMKTLRFTAYQPDQINTGVKTTNGQVLFDADLGDASGVPISESIYNVNPWWRDEKPLYRESTTTTNRLRCSGIDLWVFNNLLEITSQFPGVSQQDGVKPYDKKKSLKENYPDWTNKAKNIWAGTEDDPSKKNAILPISIPTNGEGTKPQDKAQTGENTDESIKDRIDSIQDVADSTDTIIPNVPPSDNIGDSKTPTPILGLEDIPNTGLAAIYNPTKAQLSSFSQFLWSQDFVDQIKKLMFDPMSAVIGLNVIYATPITGASKNIQVGYIDSGVSAKVVNKQYISIECGTIKINNYFGDARDYAPYTKIYIYLPFIGIRELNINDVMGASINVSYRCDVLTGTCLASINVLRNNMNACLYNFSGNCSVQLPLTGSSYSSILSIIQSVSGASSGAASGAMMGASVGGVYGAAIGGILGGGAGLISGLAGSGGSAQHSGGLGSNAGAMGIKTPYLIITRPKASDASNYNSFYGFPTNRTYKLRDLSGFTKVKDLHISNIDATDNELSEIENILKNGVIV